jgi:starvation-inducible outer membrane lipoprotein
MKSQRSAWMMTASCLGLAAALGAPPAAAQPQPTHDFSLQQVLSAPFPGDLTPAPQGGRVAWIFNDRGVRNIWVAEKDGGALHARALTN